MHPVIIFDLGKVLVDFDYTVAARKVAARSDKGAGGSCTRSSPVRHCSSNTNPAGSRAGNFSPPCAMPSAFSGELAEFGGFFADIFTEIPPMIALHAELRRRGFKTYIFSNTNDLAIEHVRRNFPFFNNFDGYIFSYEVGAMKPQPEIYAAMEKMSGKRGADLIYIDDLPENVEAGARAAGGRFCMKHRRKHGRPWKKLFNR